MSAEGKPEDLDQLLALYRQAQRPQPPAELDRRILSAARETSIVTLLPIKKLQHSRWSAPLALAASLVLGIGLLTLVRHELNQQYPTESRDFAPPSERLQNLNDAPVAAPQPAPIASEFAPEEPAPESTLQMAPAPPPAAPAAPRLPAARQADPPTLRESAPTSESMEYRIESTSPAPTTAAQEEELRSPEAWRDYILTLQEQGQIEQARQELQNLRVAYPDYPAQFPGLE